MRWRSLVLIALLLASNAILLCAIAAPDNSSGQPKETEINDSGFRPEVNGFSFPNYGDDPSIVDLTPVEMLRMFGDGVCASNAGGKCVLKFPAQRWMNEAITAMEYGHCEGIAVLSNLLYYNLVSPSRFGGKSSFELSLLNESLQREIGYWWVTQVTNPGGSNKVNESPNSVLDTLEKVFGEGRRANEWWVMGLYQPDGSGGHAITPFAVEDLGNGTSRILVYDNNWPKESRSVEVDRNSNTWSYIASVNPNEPSEVYTGNASTKSLEIVSISSRLGLQKCDFCSEENGSGLNNTRGSLNDQKHIQIWQDGRANTLITDEQGRRVGTLESGEHVNEIPGAEIRNLRFGFNKEHPPVIFVPVKPGMAPHITATISGVNNSGENNETIENKTDIADIAIIAPGLAVASSIPDLEYGQQQSIDLIPVGDGYSVNINCSQELSPTISIDTNLQQITISGANIERDGSINIGMDQTKGSFLMRTIGNRDPGAIKIQFASIDQESGKSSSFTSGDLSLQPNDGVSLNLADLRDEDHNPSLSIAHESGVVEEFNIIDISSEELPISANLTLVKLPSSPDLDSADAVISDSSNMELPGSNFPNRAPSRRQG